MSNPKPSVPQIDPRPDSDPPDAPDRAPVPGPQGPRTPYPVNDPGITDPSNQPGSAPDYIPGAPKGPMPQM